MFPLWDVAISPVIVAAGAKKVLEIGAFRGETTVRMLENLGPDSEVHVIDPVPAFDPAVHEQDFPGRYLFYRDLSHNVLPTLPAMDVALVDGDHNWFTVYHELRMLADGARRDGAPLPVLILHDVGWPYGRRDLYYDPETVPEEFRQPYRQAGMRMGRIGVGQQRRPQPDDVQRRARRRRAQRRDDRARRLHGDVRPPAPDGRAPDLLRPRDRRRAGPPRSRVPSSRPHSTISRTRPAAANCCTSPKRSTYGR